MSTSGGSTIGTSSVKRLINVVRSTQPNIGPVYSSKKLCKNFTALCLSHAMITAVLIPLYTLQSSLSLWGGSYAMGRTNFNVHDVQLWSHHGTQLYEINNQSIWKLSDADGVHPYASEKNDNIPLENMKTKNAVESARVKRDTEHSINIDRIETDLEEHRSKIDELVYPYWKDNYNGNRNKIYDKVKYEEQDESNTTYFMKNEMPVRNISKRSKKFAPGIVGISPVSKIVKRNNIPASKLTDRMDMLPNEIHYEIDNDITSFDEGVIRTIHNVDNGSLLLALMFFIGALSTIYAPFYVQKFGVKSCFIQSYIILSLFISSHYFPNVYILATTYSVFGLFIGILSHSKIQFLITLSNKFSMVQPNGNEDFISAQFTILQQLLRIYVLAQDIGVLLGGILTFYILHSHLQEHNIDYLFQYKDNGDKVCGSAYCPVVSSYLPEIEDYEDDHVNIASDLSEILTTVTNETHFDRVSTFLTSISYTILPCKANSLLLSIYLGFTIISVIMSIIFIDRIKSLFNFKSHGGKRLRICSIYSTYFRYIEMAVKDSKLQLTAPLSLFIGLEQGFIYSDFMKVSVLRFHDFLTMTHFY